MIKLSVIFTVYNSHEIVKRQIKHFKKMELPDDIEIIIMDDGSFPPLEFPNHGLKNFFIYPTGNTAPWTQALARNQSIEKARGEMLLFTDIDHFFPKSTIMKCRDFDGDKMMFNRRYAILDENGDFHQDRETLLKYGWDGKRIRRHRHNNSFAIRKKAYQKMGGYREKYWKNRFHRSGDSSFFSTYERYARRGVFKPSVVDAVIYTFPASNPDPLNLFHDLSRESMPIKNDKPGGGTSTADSRVRRHKPVSIGKITKKRYQGSNTICQFLRDIYAMTDNPDIQMKCRIGMSMTKSMHNRLKKYRKIMTLNEIAEAEGDLSQYEEE